MRTYVTRWVLLWEFVLVGSWMGVAQVIGPEKKLISGGGDNPTADRVRAHIEEMERLPFDGVCVHVYKKIDGKVEPVYLHVMDPKPINFADVQEAIADLKATKFKRFKDNFLWVWICPDGGLPSVDFFDDYTVVINNWKVAAQIAKEGGYRGLFVDTEQYVTEWGPFAWTRVKYSAQKSQKEYSAQARRRGAEVMRAINEVYPDIHLLWFFGYSAVGAARWPTNQYAFVPDFIDGMLDAAQPDARIIDGHEPSYGYKTKEYFEAARDLMKNKMRETSPNPEKFARQHQAGFGLQVDCQWETLGWNQRDFLRNYWTPEEFEYAVHYALANADRYVWIWLDQGSFLTGANVPWPYVSALAAARLPHPTLPSTVARTPSDAPAPLRIGGYGGEDLAAVAGPGYCLADVLPRRWAFHPDPRETGFVEKWYAPEFDSTGWHMLLTGLEAWEPEGYKYEAYAWYRLRYDAPPLPFGKKVFLAFESVNEEMWIWVNGTLVDSRRLVTVENGKPLFVDVTGLLKRNTPNLLVVRRHTGLEPGGGWRSVKLFREK